MPRPVLTPDTKFVEVRVSSRNKLRVLYRDGDLFRVFFENRDLGEDDATAILEDAGVVVQRRKLKSLKGRWSAPEKLSEVVLSDEICGGCYEYVCRKCL